MPRKEDLEQSIRESYGIILDHEFDIRTSARPEETLRSRRMIDRQWELIWGYLKEYAPLGGAQQPADIAEIAARFSGARASRVEEAIKTIKELRGVLPDDTYEAALVALAQQQAPLQTRVSDPDAVHDAVIQSVVPHNVPPPPPEFFGRGEERARVNAGLASRWPLVCLYGIGGIGKTALAAQVVNESLQLSSGQTLMDDAPTFEGFVWVTAKDSSLVLEEVLDTTARVLGYPGIPRKAFEEKRLSVNRVLQSKKCLLVVDNYESVMDSALEEFLLLLPQPSKALVISRRQENLPGWVVTVPELTEVQALRLVRSEGRRLGLAAVEKASEQDLQHLCQATGYAPLAIKWAVGQMRFRGQSLGGVLAAFSEARADILDQLFARSWELLSEKTSPEGNAAFCG